jgi:hypothetical protein
VSTHNLKRNTLASGVLLLLNSNGGRIWRWRKVDILFLIGLGLIAYGAYTFHIELVVAGAGISGIPLTQRGDKP